MSNSDVAAALARGSSIPAPPVGELAVVRSSLHAMISKRGTQVHGRHGDTTDARGQSHTILTPPEPDSDLCSALKHVPLKRSASR